MQPPTSSHEAMPEPTAALVLWRVSMESLLATMPRKKAERFLRDLAEKLAEEENLASVFQLRPKTERAATAVATKQAVEAYARFLPIFLARLPRA